MKSRRKLRFLSTAFLLLHLTGAGLLTLTAQRDPIPAPEEKLRYRALQMKFVCQCGCSYILLNCPHLVCPSAPVMRTQILDRMRAGDTDELVVASMVGRFGEVALSQPSTEGFNLVDWVMPFVALLFGLILLQSVVKAWRKRAPATIAPTDPALMEKYKGAIEQEMKDLEE
jgi:cytochrome c-type biogenesis protein CcmH